MADRDCGEKRAPARTRTREKNRPSGWSVLGEHG